MSVLQSAPFNLLKGELIFVRVSAYNIRGWSPVSPLSDGIGVLSAPDTPKAPLMKSKTDNSITV